VELEIVSEDVRFLVIRLAHVDPEDGILDRYQGIKVSDAIDDLNGLAGHVVE
jgi:hypothetical protein